MTIISLLYCWMIGKNSMKRHCLKDFYSHFNVEDITDADYEFAKILKQKV